ncbi:hypothetical protein E2C01_100868 [Portunus trituberculatus]|uniref:Uncharacterized protein n=1 Tax=Portunus trituberculatus TaxID=210409 RepID=A0A5B7KDB1_PORTR|nr:hypothetical protein [Portunus trituberculatus]
MEATFLGPHRRCPAFHIPILCFEQPARTIAVIEARTRSSSNVKFEDTTALLQAPLPGIAFPSTSSPECDLLHEGHNTGHHMQQNTPLPLHQAQFCSRYTGKLPSVACSFHAGVLGQTGTF